MPCQPLAKVLFSMTTQSMKIERADPLPCRQVEVPLRWHNDGAPPAPRKTLKSLKFPGYRRSNAVPLRLRAFGLARCRRWLSVMASPLVTDARSVVGSIDVAAKPASSMCFSFSASISPQVAATALSTARIRPLKATKMVATRASIAVATSGLEARSLRSPS